MGRQAQWEVRLGFGHVGFEMLVLGSDEVGGQDFNLGGERRRLS